MLRLAFNEPTTAATVKELLSQLESRMESLDLL